MLTDPIQGVAVPTVAPTAPPTPEFLPEHPFEVVRHMLFGTLTGVQLTIKDLHSKQYAEPNDWSKPISTGRPNEVMAILTKKVRVA
ncbi:hypothetical protein [Leptothoe sp. PORK10 BA2]|uniref:hypothetical protein n=1 Tax=Leptothoe sp. PORK10 BA2 TaxID=3110254 RepID=UPI002B214CF5|nr:hypothetical protein [Leptothoe sp. PORK10 BA2]MEA5462569.1 hypothetical protein [Leptothoe sp. PORK10 BA2]